LIKKNIILVFKFYFLVFDFNSQSHLYIKTLLLCLCPEWPQGSEVRSYLGYESALGYALGRSIGGVRCSSRRLSICSCGRSRGYWVPALAHESLQDSGPW